VASNYLSANLTAFVEASLKNLERESLDLLQIHCPPTDVYYQPETFSALDELVRSGKIRHYGVSVERVEEGLKALEYPGVASIQVVFNVFRQRPAELLFREAASRGVGILARVPLASGLLTGKLSRASQFAADDHRTFNRQGQAFDRGETFSGVDYELGLSVAEQLQQQLPPGVSLAQWALRWILMHSAVTCAIPGARSPGQVDENVAAAKLPALDDAAMQRARSAYDDHIRASVHQRW
jgi:aryl-alcohol dehydrogenase-like predicted oxidoreductase